MFQKSQLTIMDWWLFWVLMAIPFVNIYVFLVVLLRSGINKTLQNHVRAAVLPVIILVILLLSTGIFASILNAL